LKSNERAVSRISVNTISQSASEAPAATGQWMGWLPLLVLPALSIAFRDHMPPWLFMWTLAVAIFAGLKWMTSWAARTRVPHGAARSLAYLFAWPGMDAEAFLDSRNRPAKPQPRQWMWAGVKTAFGAALLWVVARQLPAEQPLLRGWTGLFGLIFLLHFGSFHLIALGWRALGVNAEPIMAEPILSQSLGEFWGRRRNLGFRQLAHEFVFRPLSRQIGGAAAGFAVFVVSGIIHDLVISFPARGGYGLPTAYFVIQGLGVAFERSAFGRQIGLQHGIRGRIFAILVTAAPAFWLFHPAFVSRVIVPFMQAIHAL
jgi:hypothetical protein